MFKDEIHVDKKNDLRYGTTKKPVHETMNEVMQLLREYDCERIVTDQQDDNLRIGFIYQGKPYKITVPKVYVKGEYEEKIGVRVVYQYLKIILSWTDEGVMSLNKALMSNRMVKLKGKTVALGEVADQVDNGEFKEMLGDESEALPEKDEEEPEDVDFEVVEER